MPSEPTKVLSLRLPAELAKQIALVARADGVSVSRAIRESVEVHIADRRDSKDFKERLEKRIDSEVSDLRKMLDSMNR